MTKTFRDLGVDDALCDELATQGITTPFPIQELTLPLALGGHDLIGQARTGTGKTLAFGLPLLQRIDPDEAITQALVVVPTRELCLQVHDDLSIGRARGLRTISVYGGVPYEAQIEALTTGVHVVVGTPGRLLDHLNRGNLDLSQVRALVLDEADEMLDMGFLPDVERLIEACPTARHTMLFSATMPTAIVKLARRYLDHPTFIRADSEAHETAPNVEQHFFSVHRMDKPRVLARILQSPDRGGAFVFVRTKHMADRLVEELGGLGVAAIAIHGDLRQSSRERNMERFRNGKVDVLVATEVAARGLDVTNVSHVINYDCPDDEKMYLHRIGRTARAGAKGVAVTFAEFNEADRLNVIRKAVGATDESVEAVFSTSPLLTERFDLPEERPWDRFTAGRESARNERSETTGRPRRSGRGSAAEADAAPDSDERRPREQRATSDRREGARTSARTGDRTDERGDDRGDGRGDDRTDGRDGDRGARQARTDGRPKRGRRGGARGPDEPREQPRTRARKRPGAAPAGEAPGSSTGLVEVPERAGDVRELGETSEVGDTADTVEATDANIATDTTSTEEAADAVDAAEAANAADAADGPRRANERDRARSRTRTRARTRNAGDEAAGSERTTSTDTDRDRDAVADDAGDVATGSGPRTGSVRTERGRSRTGRGSDEQGASDARAEREDPRSRARAGRTRTTSGDDRRRSEGGARSTSTGRGSGRRTPDPDPGDTTIRHSEAGLAARGEGRPQLARRVKVEYLP